jgi:translocator protein
MTSKWQQWAALAGWLLLCFAAAALGGLGSADAPKLYPVLDQPAWAPPAWLFGPVWTLLYTMQAVAAWLIWRARGYTGGALPLGLFVAQLAFNALWSWLFFAWQLGALALLNILVMWVLIVITMWLFWRIRPLAAGLMLPYLLWVSFAAMLNASLWWRNPVLWM